MSADSIQQELERRLAPKLQDLEKHEQSMQQVMNNKANLEAQFSESQTVIKELELLPSDAAVYKLNGPLLVKVEAKEAKMNAQTRLDYMQGELEKLNRTLSDMEKQTETKRRELKRIHDEQMARLRSSVSS